MHLSQNFVVTTRQWPLSAFSFFCDSEFYLMEYCKKEHNEQLDEFCNSNSP